ncbi:MAG: hypothetical protein H6610_10740 [Ignavibacteriales bacterium]|nr:hypothetical protein [Ignavibacteriales bacterium]
MKFLILILTLIVSQTFAQIKVHKHLTIDDGLISNEVLSIVQDSKGYMWFATFKGISIWDGNNFKNIKKENGLTSSAVLNLLETSDSTMVINTFGKGIVTIKNNVFDTIDTEDGLTTNFVTKIRLLNDEPIIVSSAPQVLQNGKLKSFLTKPELINGPITDFIIDGDGTIYITSRNGFYVKTKDKETLYTTKDGLLTNITSFLKKDFNGNILIGSSLGLNKYNNGIISTLEFNGKPVNWTIADILCAKDGTNYYSGDNGLLIEKNGKVELLTIENGLLENPIFTLGEDKSGNIYLGYSRGGISIYTPEKFTNYEGEEFAANSILQYNNEFLLGTENGIAVLSDKSIKSITMKNGIISNYIRSITKKNNDIFIGTDAGLNILNKNKIISSIKTDKATQGIYDIEFSKFGDLVLSVRRQGITLISDQKNYQNPFITSFINTIDTTNKGNARGHGANVFLSKKNNNDKINGKIFNYINRSNGILSSWILDMLFTRDSTLVLGYHGSGVSFYKNGILKHFGKDEGLSNGIVQILLEDSENNLWIGTAQGGICIYKNGIIVDTLNVKKGLTSDDVRGIVQYSNNLFYVITDNGLNVITKKGNDFFIRQIKKEDGLISNNCNRNALYVDNDKNLWIGTTKGVSIFNPKTDKPITEPPKVYITGLEVFNESFPLEKLKNSNRLNYDQNYLKFIYSGINLSAPKKTIYKYKLVGVDKDWVTSKENNVQYTSLEKGEYLFEVKAKNQWGYWSEPAQLAFVINPAWWETWWTRLMFVVTLGFLLWLAFQYRLNYLLKLERLRTKIASDLHDEVGSMLTQISLNVDFLSFTNDEKKKEEKSNFIRSKSKEIISIMNDIVWSIDSRNDNLESLVGRINNFAFDHCSQKDISLNFIKNIDNPNKPLKITFRQNIMLIAKEAINNAVKYSDCSELIVKIKNSKNGFELLIKDNGKGFDIENVRKGSGLKNMKMRAESINANIDFTNENGFSVKVTKDKI